jgi:ubiquinone biosynthesis protein UbiJ
VADFLSEAWFTELNELLRDAGPVPLEDGTTTFRVVIEMYDAPSSVPHAITFTLNREGATVVAGDHLAADAIVRLSYQSATGLGSGRFDSATALRDGRVKVRGDMTAIVPVLAWLQRAHPNVQ